MDKMDKMDKSIANMWPIYYGVHWLQQKDSRETDDSARAIARALHSNGMPSLFHVSLRYFSGPDGPAEVKALAGDAYDLIEEHALRHTLMPGLPVEISWATEENGVGVPYRCVVRAREIGTSYTVTCDMDGKAYTISTQLDDIRLSTTFEKFDRELLLVGMTDSTGCTYIGNFTWDGKLHDDKAVCLEKGKAPTTCKYVDGILVPEPEKA